MKNGFSFLCSLIFPFLTSCGASNPPTVSPYSADMALLTVSESPNYDYGSLTVGNSLDHAFTVTNIGNANASGLTCTLATSAFNFKGGSFPGIGGTCETTLAANASCQIVITFAPQYAASFTQIIVIDYFNAVMQTSTNDPTITGTGTGS